MQLDQLLAIARTAYDQAAFDNAEAALRQLLSVDPRHGEALHLLGVIAYTRHKPEQAIDLIGQAVAVDHAKR